MLFLQRSDSTVIQFAIATPKIPLRRLLHTVSKSTRFQRMRRRQLFSENAVKVLKAQLLECTTRGVLTQQTKESYISARWIIAKYVLSSFSYRVSTRRKRFNLRKKRPLHCAVYTTLYRNPKVRVGSF